MKFGPALQFWMKNQRLSMEQVSKATGLTLDELKVIDSDDWKPEKEIIGKICKGLNIPPTYLLALSLEASDVPADRREIFNNLSKPLLQMLSQISKPQAIDLVSRERRDHFEKHGRTIEKDVKDNANGELLMAAQGLINHKYGMFPDSWYNPREAGKDNSIVEKMMSKDEIDRLVIACSLILAHIDVLLYLEGESQSEEE